MILSKLFPNLYFNYIIAYYARTGSERKVFSGFYFFRLSRCNQIEKKKNHINIINNAIETLITLLENLDDFYKDD